MKLHFLSSPFLLVGLVAANFVAIAAPLKQTDLPADPAWFLHVDCDALRPTDLGQYILSQMEKPDGQDKLGSFQATFGLDPRTQLHGLTLYGTNAAPEDGLLLVYA